jgi:ATP-dependent RNA helicase SUPV3L1/SUV3
MGALSPRTRNAQVAMFQAGEVDYLVATDAIGMGLNMDVAHVAFASLTKFDGRRTRRLSVAEMAQIAGRAGRHQRDGTFGALVEDGPGAFSEEEIYAVTEHRFPALDFLYWRDGAPDLSSIDALIASLEATSDDLVRLRRPPEATDLLVLRALADQSWVRERVRSPAMVARLWSACGLPDFRKLGVEPHARFVGRVFGHLSEGDRRIPHRWFADELARLDSVAGDVETIAGRIAAARSWAYIAHRADWLVEPLLWQERTRALEERLSDALHASLTQRFVDKRTTALLRTIGADASKLPVVIGPEGEVQVEEHVIGRLDGFRFTVASDARATDKRLLLAAAERRLAGELVKRGAALAEAKPEELTLADDRPAILWNAVEIARLASGAALARPRVVLDRALDCLDKQARAAVAARLASWVETAVRRYTPGLTALADLAEDAAAGAPVRAVAMAIGDAGGLVERTRVRGVEGLDPVQRKLLRSSGVILGTLDIFDPRLLKPAPARWRAILLAARGRPLEQLAPPGATVIAAPARTPPGFRRIGAQAVRVDLVERIARAAHDARAGRKPFAPDPALATSIGLQPDTLAKLMVRLGFRPAAAQEGQPRWTWRGVQRPPAAVASPPRRDGAFAALADVFGHG